MTLVVGHDYARENAAALERALAARRSELGALGSEDERERRAGALRAIEGYMELLREPSEPPATRNLIRYCFKLVFADGRWDVGEKQLPAAPREGDVLGFEGIGEWRIEGAQRIGTRPAGKPPRTLFVCAPVS